MLIALRSFIKDERWDDVIAALSQQSLLEELPLEAVLAGYKANTKLANPSSAEYWLDRALVLSPTNSTLQRDKGVFHQKRQEWLEAARYFEKASSLRPDVASYLGSLGVARYQLGTYQEAVESLRAALSIDEKNRGWWIRLARSLIHLNDLHNAADAYARALELQDDASTRSARDELLRQIRSGSRAASSIYYDAVFSDSTEYQKPGNASEYASVWLQIVDLLRESKAESILDLGCGPGQFAEFVAAHLPSAQYTGLDFSSVAVSRARQRCPNFLFEKKELPISAFGEFSVFDTVVCTEVLEHVERDCEILSSIPKGTYIVATVPNFDSFGHIRLFLTEDEVRERYGRLFENLLIRGIPLSSQNTLWLMHGHRSGLAIDDQPTTAVHSVAGLIDPATSTIESVLWTDGTRYAEDFLPLFGLPFVPVIESMGLNEPHVALRHDVDWSIENAFAMANVEQQLGIRSTYYLLHPDGDINLENYFGHVEGDQLVISPTLFEWAARLLDLGHEVGLHNDLITLALATRRQPGEFLEQIVEAFARRGIPVAGSVAHGSVRCRELGYLNFQLFEELQGLRVADDHRESPELFEHFSDPSVVRDGHTVSKFSLRMADYGLKYEANFVPWEIYVSDSSARWTVNRRSEAVSSFEKFEPRERMTEELSKLMYQKPPRAAVQCLVHPCHWNSVVNARQNMVPVIRKRRNQIFSAKRRSSMLERLSSFENVPLARASERFASYDQEYGSKSQLFGIATTVDRFINQLLREAAADCSSILEVGCGQGDFISSVVSRLKSANPHKKICALGVDGSPAAIITCAGRYPELEWVADELEHFLEIHDEAFLVEEGAPRRYDLILDKTGATFIEDFEQAQRYFSRIDALLNPGGLYVYVASKNFYETKLRTKIYANWQKDWLTLAGDVLESLLVDDDASADLQGYYKRVFVKRKLGPKIKGDISANLHFSEDGSCLEVRDISQPQVESTRHKIVEIAFPSIPDFGKNSSEKNVKLFFDCELMSGLIESATIRLLIEIENPDNEICGERQNVPIFIDRRSARIVVPIEHACSGSILKVKFYVDRVSKIDYSVSNFGIICPIGIIAWVGDEWLIRSCRIDREWSQIGNRCVLSTTLGDFSAEMPEGWKLSMLSEGHLKVAEHFLLSPIEHGLFGLPLYDEAPDSGNEKKGETEEARGAVDLLAFSAGEDSTAAAALLPDSTKKYFCRRQYQQYRTCSGHYVNLQDFSPLESALNNTVNAFVVPNDFEKIGLAYGFRHGYSHNFGYAAIGILLGCHLNARSISFGSVMEQVFLGSGNNYIDIGKIKTSRANMMKRLLSSIGLDLCFPTGGASEVVTNLVARKSPLGKFVVSCASADSDGNPCGVCFKCFRKLRLEGKYDYAPSESVIKALSKYPLKSATSLMYAVQKSGYRSSYTDKYLNVDLDFLNRYHGYAIDVFVPEYLQDYVRSSFEYYGVREMTEDDEKNLRSIGQVFWPEKFNAIRAGLINELP